ncbi:ribonuclease, T2 family [Legionella lansingensis]|uniref:Ribonuclease, T2 family n=1 Tax=Legionella lansingensis TaxID=45067 RepID=A0A0W0VRH6_9GAMM|nr:ribonuclease T [Legionella lansingensis]KTD22734.1 ribonuclease, T2 family [Legionella lansingensis]SNV56709.1 ribonuclease, T2 family [Legionella lansingensis]
MVTWFTIFLSFLPLFSFSSIVVTGKFEANKSCPVYVSKNKKTNPDNLFVKPSERYEIREINCPENPDWLRIEIPNIKQPLRWVSAECGEYSYQAKGKTTCEQLPDLADSYILALSWQPGFCQTYGSEAGKPECKTLSADSYQANHLVLHGLWPNQDICGQNYGFCGTEQKKNHCDYSPVNLTTTVAQELRQFMPSYAAGSCLERHEWNKHGSCQARSSDAYFSLAIRLNREVNQTVFGQFLSEHVGETVVREQLREMMAKSFGPDAKYKVYLGCKNGMLVDIYIQLPALIPQDEPLLSLVKKAPEFMHYDSCPTAIIISDFTRESWF